MSRLTWVGSFLVGVWLAAPGAAGGGGVGAAAVFAGEAGTATGGTGGGAGAGEVGTTTGGARSKTISTYFKIHFDSFFQRFYMKTSDLTLLMILLGRGIRIWFFKFAKIEFYGAFHL